MNEKYIVQSSGPGARGVRVVLRKIFTEETVNVSFAKYEKMRKAGQIEKPAFVPKEKRK